MSSPSSSLPDAEDGEIVESAIDSAPEERYSPDSPSIHDEETVGPNSPYYAPHSRSVSNRPPTPIRPLVPPPSGSRARGPPHPGPHPSEWSASHGHMPRDSHSPPAKPQLNGDAQPFYPSQTPVWNDWHQTAFSPSPPPPRNANARRNRRRGRGSQSHGGQSRLHFAANPRSSQELLPYPLQPGHYEDHRQDSRMYHGTLDHAPFARNSVSPPYTGHIPRLEGRRYCPPAELFLDPGDNAVPPDGDQVHGSNGAMYHAPTYRTYDECQPRAEYRSGNGFLQSDMYPPRSENSVEREYSPQPGETNPDQRRSPSHSDPSKAEEDEAAYRRDGQKAEEATHIDRIQVSTGDVEKEEAVRRLKEKAKNKLRLKILRSLSLPGKHGAAKPKTLSNPSLDASEFPPLSASQSNPALSSATQKGSKKKSAASSYASCVRDSGFPPLPSAKLSHSVSLPSAGVAPAVQTAPRHLIQPSAALSTASTQPVLMTPAIYSGTCLKKPTLELPSTQHQTHPQTQNFVSTSRTSYRRAPPPVAPLRVPVHQCIPTTPVTAVVDEQKVFPLPFSPNWDPLKFTVSSSEESESSEADSDAEMSGSKGGVEGGQFEVPLQTEVEEDRCMVIPRPEEEMNFRRTDAEKRRQELEKEREQLRKKMAKLQEKKKRDQRKKASPTPKPLFRASLTPSTSLFVSKQVIPVHVENDLKRGFEVLDNAVCQMGGTRASSNCPTPSDATGMSPTPTKRQKVGNTLAVENKDSQTSEAENLPIDSLAANPKCSNNSARSREMKNTGVPREPSRSLAIDSEIRDQSSTSSPGSGTISSPWNKLSLCHRDEEKKMSPISGGESELKARVEALEVELRTKSRDFLKQKEYVRLLVRAERSHAQSVERARKSRLRVSSLRAELEAAQAAYAKDEESRHTFHLSLAAVQQLGSQIGFAPISLFPATSSASSEKEIQAAQALPGPVRLSPSNKKSAAQLPLACVSPSLVLSHCAPNFTGVPLPGNGTEDIVMTPSPLTAVPLGGAFDGQNGPLTIFRAYNLWLALRNGGDGILKSLTWTILVDPMKRVCKFELTGTCINAACPDLHFRETTLNKRHALRTVESLLSLSPIFGCLNDSTVKRDMLNAKLKIRNNKDPDKIVRSLMESLCESAKNIETRRIVGQLLPSLYQSAVNRGVKSSQIGTGKMVSSNTR